MLDASLIALGFDLAQSPSSSLSATVRFTACPDRISGVFLEWLRREGAWCRGAILPVDMSTLRESNVVAKRTLSTFFLDYLITSTVIPPQERAWRRSGAFVWAVWELSPHL